MGYGMRGAGGVIPGGTIVVLLLSVGATLVFDVELLSMKWLVCSINLLLLVVVIMANLTLNIIIVIAIACFLATSCLFSLDGINTVSCVF